MAITADLESYVCVLGSETATLEEMNFLQKKIDSAAKGSYILESENRIQEQEANDREIQEMMTIFGGFCVLLARKMFCIEALVIAGPPISLTFPLAVIVV